MLHEVSVVQNADVLDTADDLTRENVDEVGELI